jgi:DNA-binding NtrC family response regulator
MQRKLNFQTVPLAEIPKEDGLAKATVVLVVDDEHVIADTLVAILSRSGYTALAAYDGASALESAFAVAPQMVITDVYMPGMSGIDLAITLRKKLPDCKILLFSGQASTVDLLTTARNAGYDFAALAKPIHPTELLAQVSKCLAPSALLEEGHDAKAAFWTLFDKGQRDAQLV